MANAGCINAYDCNGCLIQTLQQLDSACIGVGVQYTAPYQLDDKRFNYIKYTDKCGCTCCLTDENEILIYATQGVIKNLTLTNDDSNERVIVKWTDLFGSNRVKTVVRYKTGGYPSSPTDGTLAVEETTQNQYQTNGYSVSGLSDGTTYYFSVFALDGDNTTINVQSMSITTAFNFPIPTQTYAFYSLTSNGNDESGNNRNLSVGSGITFSNKYGAYFPQTKHIGMIEPFNITSSGTWTIIRWQRTLGVVESDARGIDIYFNSNWRICSLWKPDQAQQFYFGNSVSTDITETRNVWYNHIITISNGSVKLYINNNLQYSGNISTGLTSSYFRRGQEYDNAHDRQLYGYLKGIIVENKVYSDSERNKYRNKNKGGYGY